MRPMTQPQGDYRLSQSSLLLCTNSSRLRLVLDTTVATTEVEMSSRDENEN